MNHSQRQHLTAAEIATDLGIDRSSVLRLMRRYGFSGLKFGHSQQSPRRFPAGDFAKLKAALFVNTNVATVKGQA